MDRTDALFSARGKEGSMFSRIVAGTLIFSGIVPAVSSRPAARPSDGDTVVVSEKVGKVIDRMERDRYGLFRAVRGFRSAVLLKKPDGGCSFEVVHSDTGAHRDVTDQIALTEEQVRKLREYIDGPAEKPTPADFKRRGEWLSVEMEDGTTVRGELLAAGNGRLWLKDSSSAAGTEVELVRAARVTHPKQSRFFQSTGKGFLAGGMFGMLIGFAGGDDDPRGFLSMTAGQKALAAGLGLGTVGAAAGAILGLFTGIDESIDLTSVDPGRMPEIVKKLETWARFGGEIPASRQTVPIPATDRNPAAPVHAPSDGAAVEPDRHPPKVLKPGNFSRFHLVYSPRYFRFEGQGRLRGALQDLGFDDTESFSGWFGPETTYYPHNIEDPVIFFGDWSLEFSATRNFALGIAFEPLGRHGTVGRRSAGGAETFLTGYLEGRSWFMTASFFPVPDAFLTKSALKVTAGIGYARVGMDFRGSEVSYGNLNPDDAGLVTRTGLSRNTPAYLFSVEWIRFLTRRWSLGLNAGYRWIPVKTDDVPVDCPVSGAWNDPVEPARVNSVHVIIPGGTWNFGGFGIGLHFGLHL
jgi:hypothetical protein